MNKPEKTFDVELFYKQCTQLWFDFASKPGGHPGVVGPSSDQTKIWSQKKGLLLGAKAALEEVIEKIDTKVKQADIEILIEWAEKL